VAVEDDLRPGRVLGPYELILPVGTGGMARVWAARVRGRPEQVVALKMLLPQLAENPTFQEMFFDEARIASRVKHRNVAQTYELASYDGILTIVMEWVDGGSLIRTFRPGPEHDERRPRVPIPYRHAARIVADACAGLHAAHELVDENGRSLDVVHRDVSPHNILITTSGEIKLTDFGVAKARSKSHVTIAGQIKGKLAYMSPEQLMGGVVDRRSDIFGLGCVLYEMTTGERPFRGEHDPQVMAAIMLGSYVPPQGISRDFPPELAAIIARALAGDSDKRFPSAEHLRAALEQFLRTTGPPIAPHQIAMLLEERIGPEIRARAMALGPGSPPATAGAARRLPEQANGAGGMALDRRGAPPPASAGFLSLTLAVLIGAGMGLGVLFFLRGPMKKPNATTPAVASASASTSGSAAPAPTATEFSLDDDLDAAVNGDANEDATAIDAASAQRSRAVPKPPASATTAGASSNAPPDLPPNPFE
jgi:serine/threonine-protein kinase